MNKRFWMLALLCGALAGGLGLYLSQRQHAAPEAAGETADALFALTLPDSNGTPQALAQWQNRFLVVNFWATWCTPCVQEMPELSELQRELQGRPVQILGLGVDSAANIAEFAKKYPIAYPLYVTGMEGSELSQRLGNKANGLPFTVLVSARGKIVKRYLGRLKMKELRADIAKFSAEK